MTNKELSTQVAHAKGLIEGRKAQLLEVLPKHIVSILLLESWSISLLYLIKLVT